MRLVIAMTGATGAALGIRLLEVLGKLGVETHLVLSDWARATIKLETEHSVAEVRALASHAYSARDLAAAISSGSFRTDGMVVCPCSMKTLSAIRIGYSDNLITRAADVTLKERRRLVLVAREAPFSEIHLENMHYLARAGAVIFPRRWPITHGLPPSTRSPTTWSAVSSINSGSNTPKSSAGRTISNPSTAIDTSRYLTNGRRELRTARHYGRTR